jgi:DNA-directed RNA polymerase subunit M/transcription elongation factor TFIIS
MSELPKIKTVQEILEKLKIGDVTLNAKQVEKLLKLKFNREQLFSLKNKSFILEAIGLMNEIGFEESLNFFKSQKSEKEVSSIIKNFPTFNEAKHRMFIETTQYLVTTKVKSYITCLRCKQNDVSTISKQVRRADEGLTDFHTCQSCGYKWTVN